MFDAEKPLSVKKSNVKKVGVRLWSCPDGGCKMRSSGLAVRPLAVLLEVDISFKAISRADEAEAGTMATVTANRKHFAN